MHFFNFSDLNFQAAQRVMSVPKTEAFQTLQDLAQNFPIMAHSLTKTVVKSELRKEIESNQVFDSFMLCFILVAFVY